MTHSIHTGTRLALLMTRAIGNDTTGHNIKTHQYTHVLSPHDQAKLSALGQLMQMQRGLFIKSLSTCTSQTQMLTFNG